MEEVRTHIGVRFGPAVLVASAALVNMMIWIIVGMHAIQFVPGASSHDTYFIVADTQTLAVTVFAGIVMTLVHVLVSNRHRGLLGAIVIWTQAVAAAFWFLAQPLSAIMMARDVAFETVDNIERMLAVDAIVNIAMLVSGLLLIAVLLLAIFTPSNRSS